MKNLAGIILMIALLTPTLGAYIWFCCYRWQVKEGVKKQIIAGLDKCELTLVAFARGEAQARVRWEHAGEFEYLGEMYDVVDIEPKGDSTYYWCWRDRAETALNRQLEGLVAKILENSPENEARQKRLSDFYHSLFCVNAPFLRPLASKALWEAHRYFFYLMLIHRPPPVPPPRYH
ncbi:MAG: hypothetical protein H6564_00390 [Lewinellaceae bacterium]|nr:hypothetical protein [Lewinellaceae bacterium]